MKTLKMKITLLMMVILGAGLASGCGSESTATNEEDVRSDAGASRDMDGVNDPEDGTGSDDESGSDDGPGLDAGMQADENGSDEDEEPEGEAQYGVGSLVTDADGMSNGYVGIVDSLDPNLGEIDLAKAREFGGQADMWVYGGSVFVSGGDAPTVAKFSVDDEGNLTEEGEISFQGYGLTDAAFWNNTFVGDTKAYMLNGPMEAIVWNPSSMEIEGPVEFPEVGGRGNFVLRPGMPGRGNILHDGKLFQTRYWTDENYADRADDSKIIVWDVEKDEAIQVLDAPCPGLDIGTQDEDGNLYFSTWTGGVGSHHVLDTAANCAVKVDPDSLELEVAFDFADIAEGREGAALRYVGDGKFVFSAFHHERSDLENADDAFALIGEENWRLWSYDPESGEAAPIEDVRWNSGAIYTFKVGDGYYGLVPGAAYDSTTAYEITGATDPTRIYNITGWNIRLFKIR